MTSCKKRRLKSDPPVFLVDPAEGWAERVDRYHEDKDQLTIREYLGNISEAPQFKATFVKPMFPYML